MKIKTTKEVTKRKVIYTLNDMLYKSAGVYSDVENFYKFNSLCQFVGWIGGSEKQVTEEVETEIKYLAVKDEFGNTHYVREEVYTHNVNRYTCANWLLYVSDFVFDNKGKIIKCRYDTVVGFMRTLADNYFGVK